MSMFLAEYPEVESAIRLFEAWTESRMAYAQQPGMSIAIVYDQEMIWARGFGYSDAEREIPATPQSIYRIASVSKLFTSTAVMQLRDEGKLHLDDPVTNYLPWFEIGSRFKDAPAVTIRHLLTHTSGLPREAAFPYWTDFAFPTREEIIETLPRQEAAFPPETQWKYSNLGLALTGEIVAEVSGETYAEYIQRHILEPLGMSSTSVFLPEEHRERLAVGYGRRMPNGTRTKQAFTDSKGITPAANLSSTVEDLARFASLQFRDGPAGGAQVLRGSSLREMHRVHWLRDDWEGGRGLGFNVERKEGRTLVGHAGHVGGYTTQLFFSPKEKIAAVAMANADDGEPSTYVEQVFKLVAPPLNKAVAPLPGFIEVSPEWNLYTGKYRNQWGDSQVMIMEGRLMIFHPTDEDPRKSMAQLIPESGEVFWMMGQDGGTEIGERVVFELGEDGKVVRVKIGENYTFPQE